MKNLIIFTLFLCFNITHSIAQEYLRLNRETSIRFEQANYNKNKHHFNIKPYLRSSNQNEDSCMCVSSNNLIISKIINNNLLQKKINTTNITINPIVDILPTLYVKSPKILHDYKLGISANMSIGRKLFINTDIFYGIASFSNKIDKFVDSTDIIPGYGKILSKNNSSNYEYYNISAYISFNWTDYLNLQGGIGKNFWGDGYRSLFLSDNSNNYPFAKATLDIWNLKYVWLFAALKDPDSEDVTKKLKHKLLFSHYLSWNATNWLNLNFFESIISNPVDSMGITYFNINYLNPVIFFRPIEFAGGSADNALLGFGAKLKLYKKYQLYGQLVIDEFMFSEIKANKNWWGNKYGFQAGMKIFGFADIHNLFARLEYNRVRPYTYSYSNSIMCYGSYYQALAHPQGANFEELLMQIHYFKNRYSLDFQASYIESGNDFDNISYGQNIYKPYTFRKDDYGNNFKQGLLSKFSNIGITASYLLNPKMNLAVQLNVNYRQEQFGNHNLSNYFISLGIRTLLYDNENI